MSKFLSFPVNLINDCFSIHEGVRLFQGSIILTFSEHSHLLALPQPTLLALSAHVHVHFTVPTALAFVHSILCNAPSEETCLWMKKQSFIKSLVLKVQI